MEAGVVVVLQLRCLVVHFVETVSLKKNLNAPRPSEHPPARGENVKMFRWDHNSGCKYKTSSRHLNGFPDGSNVGSTV